MRFHALSTLSPADVHAGRTRAFAGDGTPFLRVPGLVQVEAVRVGPQEVPLVEEREYPLDALGKRMQVETEEMIRLDRDAEGPVLLRSLLSNNGLWQDGQPVYITGDWEAPEAPEPGDLAGSAPKGGKK